MGKVRDFKYELLEHLPYSPYLGPFNLYLFPNLKKLWQVYVWAKLTSAK